MNASGASDLLSVILGESVATWFAAAAVFVLVATALAIVRRVVRRRLLAFVDRDSASALQIARHVAERTTGWFVVLVALFAGSRLPSPSPWTDILIPSATTVGLVVQLGLWATAAMTMFLTLRRGASWPKTPGPSPQSISWDSCCVSACGPLCSSCCSIISASTSRH